MSGAIALIPARGGSRRIPRKNVRPFLGVPAIQRVIGTIQESGIVGRIIVSTDDEEIARFAAEAGAEVPGLRPAGLADDHATTIDVVRHAVDAWLDLDVEGRLLWVVYPTGLLLTAGILREADERFRVLAPEFLTSILRYPHPVERRVAMDGRGRIRPVQPEHTATRTQDLVPTFHDAGQFYIGSVSAWRTGSPALSDDTVGFELPRHAVVDIDEPEDWEQAERLGALRR